VAKDIIVIGAGLAGVSAAWALKRKGFNVAVFDSADGPAQATSFANAGALTPSEPQPWNAPGVAWDLIASLTDPNAAMKLRPAALPGLIPWGLKFLRNSTRSRHELAARANFALSRYSLEQTRAVRDALGLEFDNITHGTLRVFETAERLDHSRKAAEALADLGLNHRVLDRDEAVALEPLLAPVADKIAGAIHYPDDECGDAHKFTCALAKAAETDGVEFEWNTEVEALGDRAGDIVGVYTKTEEIEADGIVVASGHAAWKLLKPLGLHLPVRPVKGYSLTLDMSQHNERPGLPVVNDAMHAIVTPMGDRLRVAGTAEIAGENDDLTPARIDNLKRLFAGIYPELAPKLLDGEVEAWTGLRPMSADGRPFIGETRARGLWLSTGHGHLGWTQAMGSAHLLADLVAGDTPAIDPTPYAAARV